MLGSHHLRVRPTSHRFSIFQKEKEKPVDQHAMGHGISQFEDCFELK